MEPSQGTHKDPSDTSHLDAEIAALSRVADGLFTAMRRSRSATLNGRLTFAQAALLGPLAGSDALSVSALASRASVSVPTATRMLHPLEAEALVHRVRSTEDERVVLVTLTAPGRREIVLATSHLRDRQAAVFRQFSPADRSELARLLPRLADAIADGGDCPQFC